MNDTEDTGLPVQDELATLKARADMLGVNYHPSIGLEKLREKVAAEIAKVDAAPVAAAAPSAPGASAVAPAPVAPVTAAAPVAAVPFVESPGLKKRRLRDAAMRLVRIRISCMNPAKKEWQGELFTVGNAAVGSITKFVPFEAEDGYHVPHIMYEALLHRQCQVFVNAKREVAGRSVTYRKGKVIREFAIEVLPMLTQEELAELAARQAATRAID